MRGLAAAGTLLVLAGAVLLAWVVLSAPDPAVIALPPGGGDVAANEPAVIWTVVAGFAMAGGAACLGVAANQWRQGRGRTDGRR